MSSSFTGSQSGNEDAPTSSLNDVFPLLTVCRDLRAQGQFEEALALLEKAENSPSVCPDFFALRAQLLNDLGSHEDALVCCESALTIDAACAEAQFAQGLALFLLERFEEAQTVLEALVAANPAYPDAAWLRAGLLRRRRGDLEPNVLAAFDLAVTVDPDNLYCRTERADILRACGRYEEARDLYRQVQSMACADEALRVEAAFKLGCIEMVLQESFAALAAFRFVLDVAPDYPDAQAMYDLLNSERASR